jgi:CBS domain-containing protein
VLNARFRAFLLAQLTRPSAVDWLADLAHRFNIGICQRLLKLTGTIDESWSWCFWGAAGRRELLTAAEPQIALLCRDTADVERGSQALARLRADLAECDYLPYPAPEFGDFALCAPVADWEERFTQWIRNPILSGTYAARPLFDLQLAFGPADLFRQLENSIRHDLAQEPSFQRVLANDCLSALPPLTFVDDAVIEESGEKSQTFALEQRALAPIVEVGRVFALANDRTPPSDRGLLNQSSWGSPTALGSPSRERLRGARARLPEKERIFREAVETLNVLLYLQARTGLRLHSNGAEILPSQLSRLDRQALKSGFRSIHNLVEFTIEHLWMAAS